MVLKNCELTILEGIPQVLIGCLSAQVKLVHLQIVSSLNTYLLDGLLSLFDLGELDVPVTKELVLWTDAHLATKDLAVVAELGIQVLVVPVQLLETFDKDACCLNILATGLSSNGVQIVGKRPGHETSLDSRESELLCCLLGILNALEHYESIVEILEEWSAKNQSTQDHLPLDANLARTNVLLVVVGHVQVAALSGKVCNVDHAVCVVLRSGSSELHDENLKVVKVKMVMAFVVVRVAFV